MNFPSQILKHAGLVWLALSMSAALLATTFTASAEDATATSDRAEVPSFYVRAVTGPLAGKSVCYVCRNADRPVILVLLRELNPQATALLKDLDKTINGHRADGLRCFAVLLTDTQQRDSARLQTLAFDEKIDLPLTLTGEAALQGSPLAFASESKISVVLYQDRKIVRSFCFNATSCDATARKSIIAAAEDLVADRNDAVTSKE